MKDINLFRAKGSIYLREVKSKDEVLDGLDCSPIRDDPAGPDGFLIRANEKVARSIIASLKDKGFVGKIGIFGGDDAFNRRAVESLKVDYLVSPEGASREIGSKKLEIRMKDTLKQRDSGLNHVIAKMAAEKGIGVVVDMGDLRRLQVTGCRLQVARRIARIMQNVKVCRKVGCVIKVASLGKGKGEVFDLKGRRAFGESVGMSSSEVRDCVNF